MKDKHLILLIGYGDVGKRVFKVMQDSRVDFVVVDRDPDLFNNADFQYVIGNGADEEILKRAGVENASTVVVALNTDSDVIFATLISRRLNPESTILARANSLRSIDKIYKAGADYVASLSIVAGHMLAKMTSRCMTQYCDVMDEDILLYEGLEIEKHHVLEGEYLVNKSINQLDTINKVGCRIIGIQRGDNVITDIKPSIIIQKGDVLAVIGTREQVDDFLEQYVK